MLRRLVLACALVLGTAAVVTATAPLASAADPSILLPLGRYSAMVVDPAHAEVFVAGRTNQIGQRPGLGGVVVAATSGSAATYVTGTSDANGIAIGPDGLVYAAEQDGHIVAIDPVTKTITATFDTGTAGCPDSVAFAGAELWFSYGCDPGTDTGLAELDTTSSTVTAGLLAGPKTQLASLAELPGHSDTLLATDLTAVGGDLDVLSVSGTSITVQTQVADVNASDLVGSPDGTSVISWTPRSSMLVSATSWSTSRWAGSPSIR